MPKSVKVQRVYEDEIEEPVRQKKVRIMDDQLHQQRIKEMGQQFDDFDQKSNHQKTKQEKNKENQKKGEMLFQQRQKQKAISECEFCLSNDKLSQYYIRNQSTKVKQTKLLCEGFYNAYTINSANGAYIMYQRCRRGGFMNWQFLIKRIWNCIFYENISSLNMFLMLLLKCVAIPYKISKEANLNLYFKQGMDELDGFWSTHKRLLKFKRVREEVENRFLKDLHIFMQISVQKWDMFMQLRMRIIFHQILLERYWHQY